MGIDEFLKSHGLKDANDFADKYRRWSVSRIMYRLGKPNALPDSVYGDITNMLRDFVSKCDSGELSEFIKSAYEYDKIVNKLNSLYETDTIVDSEFIALGFNEKQIQRIKAELGAGFDDVKDENHLTYLTGFCERDINGYKFDDPDIRTMINDAVQEDPAKSITPITSFKELYSWFSQRVGTEICLSLKIDGINIRCFYIWGHLVFCCTRGRKTAEVVDYTKAISRKVPIYLEKDNKPYTGITRGEMYVVPDKLEYLRIKYCGSADAKKYVVPRTAAVTLGRTKHDNEDYTLLKYRTFNMVDAAKLSDKIEFLKEKGFDTVPYILTRWVGGTYEQFCIWMKKVLAFMEGIEKDSGLKCDGLVAEVNSPSEYEKGVTNGIYDMGNIAIKAGKWAPHVYEGVLEDIIVKDKSASLEFSCKGKIKPVVVESGITITTVNLFNMGLVMRNNLYIGDTIRFVFKNDNAIDWIYDDDKLDDING